MMKIAVLVKQVPDTWSDRKIDPGTKRVDRSKDAVVDEINEKAVEVALQLKEDQGGEVTVVTLGPTQAQDALRKTLAMGADAGIHIVDDAFGGSDAMQTSAALAAALSNKGFDLIIAGNESTDGRTAAVPAMLAERLGVAAITFLRSLEVKDGVATGERMLPDGRATVSASLPAVVSITEQIAEARYPNFKGILAAKKKPIETLKVADLGLEADRVGGGNSWSVVETVTPRPAREAGIVIKDDGTAGQQLADYLAREKLI